MDTKLHSSKYWYLFGAVVAAAFVFFVWANSEISREYSQLFPSAKQAQNAGKVKILIDFGNGKKRAFGGSLTQDMTVERALEASRSVAGISYVVEGGRVVEIGGVQVTADKKWHVYVNDSQKDGVPVSYLLKPGDAVMVRYQ